MSEEEEEEEGIQDTLGDEGPARSRSGSRSRSRSRSGSRSKSRYALTNVCFSNGGVVCSCKLNKTKFMSRMRWSNFVSDYFYALNSFHC